MQEVLEGAQGSLARVELRVKNALGELVEVHDARGHVTRMTYDGQGLLTKVVRPLHQGATPPVARRMQWDGFGRLTEAVDKAGHQTPIEPLWPPR